MGQVAVACGCAKDITKEATFVI